MSKSKNRIIFKRNNGEWINKKINSDRASSIHKTQAEAESAAREILKKCGGGELITKGLNGKIRSKDTIAPANDHHPPKDREH